MNLISTIPLIAEGGRIADFSNKYLVFYFGKLRMVRQSNQQIFTETTINKQGEFISGKTLSQDTTLKYFIYKKGDNKGLLYRSEYLSKSKPFSVDSLEKRLFNSENLMLIA